MDKAWIVSGDEYSVIAFAETRGQARSIGSCALNLEFVEAKAKRAKQFDEYTESKKVPKQAMIDDGWRFECQECFQWVSEDATVIGDDVYCPDCASKKGR